MTLTPKHTLFTSPCPYDLRRSSYAYLRSRLKHIHINLQKISYKREMKCGMNAAVIAERKQWRLKLATQKPVPRE